MSDARYLSCAETAKLVRAALKASFPATKFSVVSKSYSGGASITIRWTDGPTGKRVDEVVDCFSGADFDGMVDLKTHRPAMIVNGEKVHSGADFIFTEREASEAFWTKVAGLVAKRFGVETPRDKSAANQIYVAGRCFQQWVWIAMGDRTQLI
jgi:hypothetical protein